MTPEWHRKNFQNDAKTSLTVARTGNFTINPSQELYTNHLYNGWDNNITMSRTYSVDFLCTFNMMYYPFDRQECNMTFVLPVG